MSVQTIPYPTLISHLWARPAWLRNLILLAAGVSLLTVSAKLKIPFYPVPMTMQTFMVLALGMVYGWRLGALTVLSYLAVGAFGFPVFANTHVPSIGLAYMMGPTGGYLLGFVLATAVVGYLAELGWSRRVASTFFAMLMGNILIYICGLIWLGTLFGWDKPILELGLYPFVLADIVKIILAMWLLPTAWKLLGKKT